MNKNKKRKDASKYNDAFDGENQLDKKNDEINSPRERILSNIIVKHIILDCSPFNFLDSMGANSILHVGLLIIIHFN